MRRFTKRRRLASAMALVALVAIGGGAAALAAVEGRHASPTALAEGPSSAQIQAVPAPMAAAFPLLSRPTSSEEASQLPLVKTAIDELERQPLGGNPGANPSLARAYYQTAAGDAGYLVPAGEGSMCLVQISAGEVIGVGCSHEADLLTKGSVSVKVVSGGYDVSGLLPAGTKSVTIGSGTDASAVRVNGDGGFDLLTNAWPQEIAYRLPSGVEEAVTMQAPGSGDSK